MNSKIKIRLVEITLIFLFAIACSFLVFSSASANDGNGYPTSNSPMHVVSSSWPTHVTSTIRYDLSGDPTNKWIYCHDSSATDMQGWIYQQGSSSLPLRGMYTSTSGDDVANEWDCDGGNHSMLDGNFTLHDAASQVFEAWEHQYTLPSGAQYFLVLIPRTGQVGACSQLSYTDCYTTYVASQTRTVVECLGRPSWDGTCNYTSGINPSTRTISMIFPVNGQEVEDFKLWTVQVFAGSSTTHKRYVVVDYATSSATVGTSKVDSKETSNTAYSTFQFSFNKINTLTTSTLTATWYAQASLVEGSSTVATSSIIQFTVNYPPGGNKIQGIGNYTNTTNIILAEEEDNCEIYQGGLFSSSTLQALACYARTIPKNILVWLFVTSSDFMDDKKTNLEECEDVYPFSIAFAVSITVQDNASSSDANYTYSVPLPWATSTQFTVLNSSTLQSRFGSTAKNAYFTAAEAAIWIGTALAILAVI